MTDDTRKKYSDAAKLDMIELFQKETLDVFEFRRIAEICNIMIPLLNSVGSSFSHQSVSDALWHAEDRARNLHHVLGGHTFDGNEMLREKYRSMAELHGTLRAKYADVLEREADLIQVKNHLALKEINLETEARALAAERRVLSLREGSAMDEIPALPANIVESPSEPADETPLADSDETSEPKKKKLFGIF